MSKLIDKNSKSHIRTYAIGGLRMSNIEKFKEAMDLSRKSSSEREKELEAAKKRDKEIESEKRERANLERLEKTIELLKIKDFWFFAELLSDNLIYLYAALQSGPVVRFSTLSNKWVYSSMTFDRLQQNRFTDGHFFIAPEIAKKVYGNVLPDETLFYEWERIESKIQEAADEELYEAMKEIKEAKMRVSYGNRWKTIEELKAEAEVMNQRLANHFKKSIAVANPTTKEERTIKPGVQLYGDVDSLIKRLCALAKNDGEDDLENITTTE